MTTEQLTNRIYQLEKAFEAFIEDANNSSNFDLQWGDPSPEWVEALARAEHILYDEQLDEEN